MSAKVNDKIDQWFESRGLPLLEWDSRDYFTDEAANARLLEAMPEPTLKVDRYSGNWLCYASPAFTMLEHKDRKTAVVMAFCKFAGIEQ